MATVKPDPGPGDATFRGGAPGAQSALRGGQPATIAPLVRELTAGASLNPTNLSLILSVRFNYRSHPVPCKIEEIGNSEEVLFHV
jgi:hypothetical protein